MTDLSLLTPLKKRAERRGKVWFGLYLCVCGKQKMIRDYHVSTGATISCGCESIRKSRERMRTHITFLLEHTTAEYGTDNHHKEEKAV